MSGWTDLVELALLNHFFTDPAYTPPATMYLALSTTTPTEAGGNFTEQVIGTGAYARVATTATDWSAASGTAPCVKTNTATLTFPTATLTWVAGANFTYFGLYDAASAGNLLCFGALTVPKPVLAGDTASFGASGLTLKLGDVGDPF